MGFVFFSLCFASVFSFRFRNKGCFPFILLKNILFFALFFRFAYFVLFRFALFVSFRFTSFSFRIWNPLFRLKAKHAQRTPLFRFEAKIISLPFRTVSLWTENERRTLGWTAGVPYKDAVNGRSGSWHMWRGPASTTAGHTPNTSTNTPVLCTYGAGKLQQSDSLLQQKTCV